MRAPDARRVHVARVEYESDADRVGDCRVFLSNGDELVGLSRVEASSAIDDYTHFSIEGIVLPDTDKE